MAASTKAVRIGVIAEDNSDLDVIYELTCKIVRENQFSFARFVGHGSGRVRRKCRAWARNLLDRGCAHIIVVHDLDRCVEHELRQLLEAQLTDLHFETSIVLIPVEELEAWLMSDPTALKVVFNMNKVPKVPKWPEKIQSPKEYLANLIRTDSKAQYLNTVHNRKIAKALELSSLERCPSFLAFPEFLSRVFPRSSSRIAGEDG
jgi:hypothetical protein